MPPSLSGLCFNTSRYHVSFSECILCSLLVCRFLQDLEHRLEEDILRFDVCDIVLEHCPALRRVYLPYVTNQAYQEQTYQRLLWVTTFTVCTVNHLLESSEHICTCTVCRCYLSVHTPMAVVYKVQLFHAGCPYFPLRVFRCYFTPAWLNLHVVHLEKAEHFFSMLEFTPTFTKSH